MKLDPGMHIGLYLVFFGKSGVTPSGSTAGPFGGAVEGRRGKGGGGVATRVARASSEKIKKMLA
jgi:hypothetical protein